MTLDLNVQDAKTYEQLDGLVVGLRLEQTFDVLRGGRPFPRLKPSRLLPGDQIQTVWWAALWQSPVNGQLTEFGIQIPSDTGTVSVLLEYALHKAREQLASENPFTS